MPRAIEIRIDPKTQGVVIDTNFPNREVTGASWAPQFFRLGWDAPEAIWEAMQDCVPTLICRRVALRESYDPNAGILIQGTEETDGLIEAALKLAQLDERGGLPRIVMPGFVSYADRGAVL